MTEHQLASLLVADISDVKFAGFISKNGIEQHMLHDITKLLFHIMHIIVHQCVSKLEGFFNGIGAQTLKRLFAVPGALFTKALLDIKQVAKGFYFIFSRIHCYIFSMQK